MRISGGQARGRRLSRRVSEGVRPPLVRMRKSIFSILGDRVDGAHVLDLFAGAGTFGLEALSRGARSAVFVESDARAARELDTSIAELGCRAVCRVLRADALSRSPAATLGAPPFAPYDLVFADPPFALFGEPGGAESVLRSFEALLGSSLLSAAPAAVLRVPRRADVAPAVEPSGDRTYGISRVLFFEPTGGAS